MVGLGFEQCKVNTCMFHILEDGDVVMLVVVHVDDVCAIGEKESCVKFGVELNRFVRTTDLRELRWYAGCVFRGTGSQGRLRFRSRL